MANPFNIQKNTQNNELKKAYQMFSNSRNPQEVFMKMAQNNPQLQPIVNMVRQGANPQQLFMSMCQQRGINPQDFLNQITGK